MRTLKLLFSFASIALFSMLLAPVAGISAPVLFGAQVVGSLAMSMMPQGSLFSGLISVTDLAAELRDFFKVETKLPAKWFYSTEIFLRKYATRVSKVKNRWIVPHSLMTNVVQGFSDTFTPLGELIIRDREMKAFHLKVNYLVKPTQLEGTYLAWANEENLALKDRSISRYIATFMEEKVVDDIDILSISGTFDDDLKDQEFGYSMDGIVTVLDAMVTETKAGTAKNPTFLIPVDAIDGDGSNIVEVVTAWERGLPSKMKKKVKYVFMSERNAEEYRLRYEEEFGTIVTHSDTKNYRTRLGNREIIGIPDAAVGDYIFGFAEKNLLELIDLNDVPRVHDVQTFDYSVKIFAEGHLGYTFGYPQAVFVADSEVAARGLQNAEMNQLYYESERLNEGVGSGSGSGSGA
jgi:hypothetical protein